MIALTLMCCVMASAQTAKVTESLSDGSYIVLIDGKEYRAIDAGQMRVLSRYKLRVETLEEESELKSEIIAEQRKQKTELRSALDESKTTIELLKKPKPSSGIGKIINSVPGRILFTLAPLIIALVK